MKGTIRSQIFDDVYFSRQDGLAETQHVFLRHNGLPEAFAVSNPFVVGETGFGTGLNFLALWEIFNIYREQNTHILQKLRFVSFEKYPLSVQEIRTALHPWADRFGAKMEAMLSMYPDQCIGHVDLLLDEGVELCLIFGDINTTISELEAEVDCWFLDGFTPSKNPDMWSDIVFQHMARLTRVGGTFATFTAAGFVKRGLQNVGFDVSKCDGFGSKRDMLVGKFLGRNAK